MMENFQNVSNSLQTSLCARDTIDQIILSLNSEIGKDLVYILIEGIYDCKIYSKLFDQEKTNVEYVNGKGQVSTALNELNNITKQVIGICDADFSHLQNISPNIYNLFLTDFHDIEMTMLSINGVLKDALTEYELQNNTSEILQKALNETRIISYIRWFNQINNTKLRFDNMGLGGFVMPHDINAHLDIEAYLCALNKRSLNKTKAVTVDDITQFIQSNNCIDLFNLCNGHDVTALITLIIGSTTSHEIFCSILRASFNIQYFNKTQLYINIQNWQNSYDFSIFRG